MSSLEDLGRRESVEESEKRRILRSAILDLTDQAQQDDLRLDPELIKKSNQLAAQIKEVPEALLDSRLAVILGQKGTHFYPIGADKIKRFSHNLVPSASKPQYS